ncbi:MAG: hypothetical protein H7641_15090, partial [Candidatus Heimdallarchaeota archaeon]|nr:hypothetical protein [Candidatus Heimdallarchaeota archaeon]
MDDELERIRKEKLTKMMNDDVPVVGTFQIADLAELNEQTFDGFVGQS